MSDSKEAVTFAYGVKQNDMSFKNGLSAAAFSGVFDTFSLNASFSWLHFDINISINDVLHAFEHFAFTSENYATFVMF